MMGMSGMQNTFRISRKSIDTEPVNTAGSYLHFYNSTVDYTSSMKTVNTYRLLFILISITSILYSCNDGEKQVKNNAKTRYAINLFPEELTPENGKINRPMTYKEAVAKSVLTFRVPEIILVDKSTGRGNKSLYLYKIRSGKAIKPAKGKKKYPIYFIAYKNLSSEKNSKDAVFVFLENIRNNKILTKQRSIKYQWISDAPLL
ncbi:MAG: hypothetical protein E6Q66_10015 [Pedobacter sp.]|nr:MAG: hypothetical protein E6Q66_10015 [Pedobacter sp.]